MFLDTSLVYRHNQFIHFADCRIDSANAHLMLSMNTLQCRLFSQLSSSQPADIYRHRVLFVWASVGLPWMQWDGAGAHML